LIQLFPLIFVRLLLHQLAFCRKRVTSTDAWTRSRLSTPKTEPWGEQLTQECRYLALFLSEQGVSVSIVCKSSAQHGADFERDPIAMIRDPFLVSRKPLGADIFSRTAFDQFSHALGFSCSAPLVLRLPS
jgi:hypothetical protein